MGDSVAGEVRLAAAVLADVASLQPHPHRLGRGRLKSREPMMAIGARFTSPHPEEEQPGKEQDERLERNPPIVHIAPAGGRDTYAFNSGRRMWNRSISSLRIHGYCTVEVRQYLPQFRRVGYAHQYYCLTKTGGHSPPYKTCHHPELSC